jgi:hypothetical protein
MALRQEISLAEALVAGASNRLQRIISERLTQQIVISNNLPLGKIARMARQMVEANPSYVTARKIGTFGRLEELTEGQHFDEPIVISHLTTIRRKLADLASFNPEG